GGEQQHQQGPQEAPYDPLLLVAGEADGWDVAPQPPTSRRRVGGAGPRRPRCRTAKAAPPATAMRTRTSLRLGVTPAQHLPSPPRVKGITSPGGGREGTTTHALARSHLIVFSASLSRATTDISRCSSLVSSILLCEMPWRLCTKSITVGTPARATSAASCSGPLGRRCDTPAVSLTASSASSISSGWNGIGSMRHRRLHDTSTSPSRAKRSLAAFASASM